MTDIVTRSPRSALRRLINQAISGEQEISRDAVIEEVRARVFEDPELQEAICHEAVAMLVPEILNNIMGRQRQDVVSTAFGWVNRDHLKETAADRFAELFAGNGVGYISLIAARKGDGEMDLLRRLNAQKGHQPFIDFWREVLPKMDDHRTVGETFSNRQLDRLWQKHFFRKID